MIKQQDNTQVKKIPENEININDNLLHLASEDDQYHMVFGNDKEGVEALARHVRELVKYGYIVYKRSNKPNRTIFFEGRK